MSGIEVSNSRAIQLAIATQKDFEENKQWIKEFKSKIETARGRYDEENDQYDWAENYPEQKFLEGRHQEWTEQLRKYSSQQRDLLELNRKLNENWMKLKSVSLDPSMIENLKLIHQRAGEEIETYHSDLQSRMEALSRRFLKLERVVQKVNIEINWILNHPHQRLKQMIDRVASGQRTPSYISQINDRIVRNFSSVSSLLGLQQPYDLNAELPPNGESSSNTEQEE